MSDPIGEFSLNHTGTTYAKVADGNLASYANFNGTATGYGQVYGTIIVSAPLADAGASSGSVTWASNAFLEDGTTLGGIGEGTYEQAAGEHVWKISMVVEVSNGERLRSEGEISLANLNYTGKIYAAD